MRVISLLLLCILLFKAPVIVHGHDNHYLDAPDYYQSNSNRLLAMSVLGEEAEEIGEAANVEGEAIQFEECNGESCPLIFVTTTEVVNASGSNFQSCFDYWEASQLLGLIPESGWWNMYGNYSLWCDFDNACGCPWTTWINSKTKNYRLTGSYQDYTNGMKYSDRSFFTSLDAIHKQCNSNSPCKLWIHLCENRQTCYDIRFDKFYLGNTQSNYKLHWSGLTLSWQLASSAQYLLRSNGQVFSTYDNDSSTCATRAKGGWWYPHNQCNDVNLGNNGFCLRVNNRLRCFKNITFNVQQ